jgi:ParB family chromosome partitioning protein
VAERRGGLGRGLGAVFAVTATAGDDEAPAAGPPGSGVQGAHLRELPLDAITPNPRQPRTQFDDDALAELAASLREVGILQPVVVRAVAGAESGRYELVMGERRWRAAQAAGLETIPAIVRETADDALLRDALLENLHRQQLNPLEEAAAYQQLLAEFGATHEQLASRLGRSRPQISNTLRLLQLPAGVQRRVAAGVLSAGHARALLALPDGDAQERLATRITTEGLSVRAVEELVAVGEDPSKPARARRPRGVQAPEAEAVAAALADRLETRVRVDMGATRGRITVEVADLDDLKRVAAVLGVDVP